VQRSPPVLFIEPGIHKESDQASLSISRTRSNKSGKSHTPTDVDSAIQAVLAGYDDIASGQNPDVRPLARRLCECADLRSNISCRFESFAMTPGRQLCLHCHTGGRNSL
jgi:hypothetical protein